MNTSKAQNLLKPIIAFLREFETPKYCNSIEKELKQKGINKFLVSNSLWGGAGSIADQAGINDDKKTRKQIEELLIKLGEYQISVGVVNPRTESWINAFKEWKSKNI